jgi:hypothetical protein
VTHVLQTAHRRRPVPKLSGQLGVVGQGAPIAAAYVAGRLDDEEQRLLLEAKLAEIEERRRQLGQMSEFLRSKLNDLPAKD